MQFDLIFSDEANETLSQLEAQNEKKLLKVQKTLGLLQLNPRHTGLQTHKFTAYTGPNGEEVFEAYVENRTPSAYRVFWHYGPGRGIISIIAITPHP